MLQGDLALCPTWASTLTEYEPTLTQHVPSEVVVRAERVGRATRDLLALGDGCWRGTDEDVRRSVAAHLLFVRWRLNRRLDLRRRVCVSGGEGLFDA